MVAVPADSGGAAHQNAMPWLPCVDLHSESYFTSVKRIGGVGSLPISARGFVGVAIKEVVGLFD